MQAPPHTKAPWFLSSIRNDSDWTETGMGLTRTKRNKFAKLANGWPAHRASLWQGPASANLFPFHKLLFGCESVSSFSSAYLFFHLVLPLQKDVEDQALAQTTHFCLFWGRSCDPHFLQTSHFCGQQPWSLISSSACAFLFPVRFIEPSARSQLCE